MYKRFFSIILIMLVIVFLFASYSFASPLKIKDYGEEVRKVQHKLSLLGYDISVDGIFGSDTKNIVKTFQLSNGLVVDGTVGNTTLNLLNEMTETVSYKVKRGDSLSEIALKYNYSINVIKKLNNIDSDKIYIDQELLIPQTGIGGSGYNRFNNTIIYEVQAGDTLYGIARKNDCHINSIKKINGLKSNQIYDGQSLIIPLPKDTNVTHTFFSNILWPAIGRISSGYGYRNDPFTNHCEFHGGIDIAVPIGTKVKAVESGTVIWSGWAKGFGKTIVIDHGNDVKTLYGHNSKLIIPVNTKVDKGQVIALSGNTGRSTGPHLDFRIYIQGQTTEPRDYLK